MIVLFSMHTGPEAELVAAIVLLLSLGVTVAWLWALLR